MTYVIAEIGSNHNGSMITAKKLIDEAQRAGASAVKFQSWTPESLYAKSWLADNPEMHKELDRHSLSIKELKYLANYTKTHLSWIGDGTKHREVKYPDFICSVFSRQEVDDLEDVLDFYKIASMDLNNTRLLKHVASKRKPTIISTGMRTDGEIQEAVKTFKGIPLTLLHCVSLYPPKNEQIALYMLGRLKVFGANVGYSDHTAGITACLAAVALGAVVIEKHFTLDKTQDGWDHHISADPVELQSLVKQAEQINDMLSGYPRADIRRKEVMRRSLVANKDLKAGHTLKEDDVIRRRPGTGLQKLGKLTVDVGEGQMLIEGDTLGV